MIAEGLRYTMDECRERLPRPLFRKLEYSVNLLRKAERLAQAYDKENGYFLAFSGGKDSQALYHVTQIAGVKFKAHMNLTSVDPPEVIRFVKTHYPNCEKIKPKKSIFQTAIERGILPTMRVRWCCKDYKESAGAGKVTLIGIRHEESSRRAKRNEVEINNRKFSGTLEELDTFREEQANNKQRKAKLEINITNASGESTVGCISGKESLLISPIIHWTERDVWDFLNSLEIPHCELYDQGYSRIGCILCPMSQFKQKQKEMQRWPHVKRNWIKAIMAIRRGGVRNVRITKQLPPPLTPQTNQVLRTVRKKFAEGYIWWNIPTSLTPTTRVGARLRTATTTERTIHSTSSVETRCAILPPPIQNHRQSEPKVHHTMAMATGQETMDVSTREFGQGFSDSSSSIRETEEQELEIAENIFAWWISGKSYKEWYIDTFRQLKFDFDDDNGRI